MNSPLNLLVVDGKTITKTASLPQTAKGQPVHIKAIDGGKYLLSSGENQTAPDHIVVKRVGKDLQIFTQDGDDTPEIIIDGFYDHQGELSGMTADGTYHTYVNQDGSDRDAFLLLDDSGASILVLGSESTGGLEGLVAAGGLTSGMIALGALAALAALTGIAIAAHNGGGHHDDNNKSDSPAPMPHGSIAEDHVGAVQGKIAQNGVTDDSMPVLSGSATSGSTVNIYDHGKLIGSAVAGTSGSWEFKPVTALTEGPHSISFSEITAGGIESPQTAPLNFTVDTTPPAEADVISLADGKGQDLTHGGLTNDGDVRMSGGGATPGDVVKLYDGDKPIGSAIVDKDGNWTVPGTIVGDGKHDLSVGITDPAGNESARSLPIPVDLDTTAPAAPAPTLTDGNGLDLTHGGLTNNGDMDMSGTGGTPGDIVKLYDGDKLVGSTTVDKDGNWTIPDALIGDGKHDLSASYTDPAGNESAKSAPITVDLDTTPPATPTPTLEDGNHLDLTHGGATNNGSLEMSGSGGTEGDIVKLYDGDTLIGTDVVGPDGSWTVTGPISGDGIHPISASLTDPAGNESAKSAPIAVDLDTVAPASPTPHLEDGNGLDLTTGGLTNNGNLEMSGSGGTKGDIVKLYDGATLIGSAVVGDGGVWTVPGAIGGDGTHPISASFTDPAGNESLKSAPIAVDLDTIAPSVPATPTLEDGNAKDLTAGGLTNNGNLDMSGTGGTEGEIVKLYDGNTLIGSAIVGPGGVWDVTGPITGDGTHPISASYTDKAGNESAKSAPIAVDLDTTAPAAPTPTLEDGNDKDLTAGGATNNGNMEMSGSGGVEGDIVKLYDGSTLIGSNIVGPGGAWTVTGPITGDGTHPISASFTDPAGNESAKSTPIAVDLDTVAPVKPVIVSADDTTGTVTDPLHSGDWTDEKQPLLSGTSGEEGLRVELRDQSGTLIGTAITGPGGSWSVSPDLALANGDYNFTVRLIDDAGNSTDSDPFELHIDDTVPTAPTITDLDDNVGLDTGSLLSGAITDDTMPTLNGSGPANGQVVLMNNGSPIATVDVDPSGNWNWTPTADMAYGNYEITAQPISQAGVTGPVSIEFDFKLAETVLDPFSSYAEGSTVASGTHMNGYTLTYTGNPNLKVGSITWLPAAGKVLQLNAPSLSMTMELNLDSPAYNFSIETAGIDAASGTAWLNFYDTNNNLLGTQPLPGRGVAATTSYTAPDGSLIGRVEIVALNESSGFIVDNIQYSKANAADITVVHSAGISSVTDDSASSDAGHGIMAVSSVTDEHSDAPQPQRADEHHDQQSSINGQPLNTLVIDEAEQPINLSNITHQQPEVDVIDITAKGDTTLNLNVNDVLAMGSEDLFLNTGSTQLMIKGDAGDTVNLETVNGDKSPEQWNAQGEVTMDGTTYNVYQNSDHEVDVLIQQGVQVHQQ